MWRLSNLYKIKTKKGTIETFKPNKAQQAFLASYTGKDIILKARQMGFCLDPETRVLKADLTWVPIKDISVGDEVVAVDEFPGEGRGKGRKMKTATVEGKVVHVRDAHRITFEDGRSVVCTSLHPWLSRRRGGVDTVWRSIEKRKDLRGQSLEVGDVVRSITDVWEEPSLEDYWMAGIIDGEGSMNHSKGGFITVSQVEGGVWDRMVRFARERGYSCTVETDSRDPSETSKLGSKDVKRLCFGRMNDLFRLLGQTRPTRFVEERFWEGRELPGKKTSFGWVKVVKIERLPDQQMVDLQTSEKTFIAEGFVSHNTTLVALILLDLTLFTPNTTSVILAHTDKSVKKIFRIIRFAYDNINLPVKPEAKYDNREELFFDDINSTIYVALSVRGDTVNNLHVSELAFIPDAEDRMIATFAAVPPGGRISIESTAQGIGNYFYDFYMEAEERGFKSHFYPWFYAEEYRSSAHGFTCSEAEQAIKEKYGLQNNQMAWYRHNKALLKDKFEQEYPANAFEAFVASGSNVFDVTLIQDIRPEEGKNHLYGTMFEEPVFGREYAIGIDTSEAVGRDEHSLDVIDIETGAQVFHYSGQLPFESFIERVRQISQLYNRPLLVPEANNHGYALIKMLQDDRNLRIYRRRRYDVARNTKENKLGFLTTRKTKPILIEEINRALHAGEITIRNKKTLGQMLSYLYTEKGMEAASGKKDDAVMSLALAWHGVMEELEHFNRRSAKSYLLKEDARSSAHTVKRFTKY